MSTEFLSKRAWIKAHRGVLTDVAFAAKCTRQFVYQVFYYGIPSKDGLVERLLYKRGAPHMEDRIRSEHP